MVQGALHETRARIAFMAGRLDDYRHSLTLAEHWFRGTGTPALIARYERVAALGESKPTSPPVVPGEQVTTGETTRTDSTTADVKTVVANRRTA